MTKLETVALLLNAGIELMKPVFIFLFVSILIILSL